MLFLFFIKRDFRGRTNLSVPATLEWNWHYFKKSPNYYYYHICFAYQIKICICHQDIQLGAFYLVVDTARSGAVGFSAQFQGLGESQEVASRT